MDHSQLRTGTFVASVGVDESGNSEPSSLPIVPISQANSVI